MEPFCCVGVGGDDQNPQSTTDAQNKSTEER